MKVFKSLALIILVLIMANFTSNSDDKMVHNHPVHFYSALDIDGNDIKLEQYKGKVLLIVNVASKCGFTPQYEGLQALYAKYHERGFEILAFPCNQFRNQEPGTNQEIKEFCHAKFGISFQLFDKIDVNGETAHPLYKYLTADGTNPIKWNFEKFLVDQNGIVLKRYGTKTDPKDIEADIEKILSGKKEE